MDHTDIADLPRYIVIARGIEADIRAGRLEEGTRLPSERDIAKQNHISRTTARQALQHLTRAGLLEPQVGRGTFVRSGAIQQELTTLTGFSEEMGRQGRTSSSIVIEAVTVPADPTTALALGLDRGALVHRLGRIRLVDGAPVAIETSQIDAARTPGFLDGADFANESTYARLRARYGISPTTAEQTLEAAGASRETAHRLNLDAGAPILRLTRLTRDETGRAFEYVGSLYRGDVFNMKVYLQLGSPSK